MKENFLFFPSLIIFSFFSSIENSLAVVPISHPNCIEVTEQKIINGPSLAPIFQNGQRVSMVHFNPECYRLQHEDIIVYKYPWRNHPLIKIIKGLPGDRLFLKPADKSKTKWCLVINHKIVKNSERVPYSIGLRGYHRLKRFEGVIPQGQYLILGNLPKGSLDSTAFGLIKEENILGIVSLENK